MNSDVLDTPNEYKIVLKIFGLSRHPCFHCQQENQKKIVGYELFRPLATVFSGNPENPGLITDQFKFWERGGELEKLALYSNLKRKFSGVS